MQFLPGRPSDGSPPAAGTPGCSVSLFLPSIPPASHPLDLKYVDMRARARARTYVHEAAIASASFRLFHLSSEYTLRSTLALLLTQPSLLPLILALAASILLLALTFFAS